jgi:hypothetical protein
MRVLKILECSSLSFRPCFRIYPVGRGKATRNFYQDVRNTTHYIPAFSGEMRQLLSLRVMMPTSQSQSHSQSQSQSHSATDSQSASPSWRQALVWDPRPIFPHFLFDYFF